MANKTEYGHWAPPQQGQQPQPQQPQPQQWPQQAQQQQPYQPTSPHAATLYQQQGPTPEQIAAHQAQQQKAAWDAYYAQQAQMQAQQQADQAQLAQQQAQAQQYQQYPQAQASDRPRSSSPPPPVVAAAADSGVVVSGGEPPKLRQEATEGQSDRLRFIRLTYLHLLLAVLAFAGMEYLFQTVPVLIEKVSNPFTNWALESPRHWGIVLAAFAGSSWVAHLWTKRTSNKAVQYFGLLLYVLAEAVIFIPLLQLVDEETRLLLMKGGEDPHILRDAGIATVAIFLALTVSVFVSKKDWSWLRSGLSIASGAALALIIMSLMFGFNLGIVFSIAMVFLAAGYMLYETSQVLAHYDPRSHVAAALALFSSLALMFWYIIRIFMRLRAE